MSAQPDVFISYAREDATFVRRLHAALTERGEDVWVDWEDIPPTAAWRTEVDDAIAASDAFLFVISPNSRESRVCAHELERAVDCRKRIVPLVREPVDADELPAALGEPNWISFADDTAFDESLATLVAALETDLDWVRTHTRLLVAARRWSERRDRSLLLSGSDLRETEHELAANADKEPRPTPLQAEFVLASRRAVARRQRITLGATLAALAVAIALGVVALAQRNSARSERDRANAQARLATARQLAAQSAAAAGPKLDLSLLLARGAQLVEPTPEGRAALLGAVSSTPQIRTFLPVGAEVTDVAFSPDGRLLAAGAADGRVVVWDARSLARRGVLRGRAAVTGIRFSPDSRTLAVGYGDGTVELWSAARLRPLRRLRALHGAITSVWLGRRESAVAAGDASGRIAVWSGRRLGLSRVLRIARPPQALALARDRLVVGDGFETDLLFGMRTGKQLRTPNVTIGFADAPGVPTYSADANRVAIGTPNGFIQVESARNGGGQLPIQGPPVPVEVMAFDANAKHLVSVGEGTLTLWALRRKPRRIAGPFHGFSGRSAQAALADDARAAAVANGTRVVVWRFTARSRLRRTIDGRAGGPPQCCEVAAAAFSPDGRRVVWFEPPDVTLQPHIAARALGARSRVVRSAAALPDGGLPFFILYGANGRRVASIDQSFRKVVVVRDPQTLRTERVAHLRFEVAGAAFVRDTPRLVAVGLSGAGVAVDTDDGRVRLIMHGVRPRLAAVAVSSDGTSIATLRRDRDVQLRDDTGRRTASFRAGVAPAGAAFSRDGRLLAIVGADGTAEIWDARTRVRLRTLQLGEPTVVRFSPDGRTLAAATTDGSVELWDVDSGTHLGSLPSDGSGYPVDFAFAPDGKTLLVTDAGGTAYTWNLDEAAWTRIACRTAGRTLTPSEQKQFLGAYASSIRVCD